MEASVQSSQVCTISGETFSEERANFLTHSVGLALSIAGFLFLVVAAISSFESWFPLTWIVYGITLVLMFSASTLYHSCKVIDKKKKFRIFDHVCIYFLIAGSYTPILFQSFDSSTAWVFCAAIWTIAFAGAFLKIYFTGRFVFLSTLLYLLMGWCCLLIIDEIAISLSEQGITWLAAGGIFYSLGVIFFLWEKLPFNHSIWHVFVLGGSACHYYLITFYIALG